MTYIDVDVKDKIACIELNRPRALNALNSELLSELNNSLKELEKEEDLRCIIVSGSGDRAFAAGADIGEMADMDADEAEDFSAFGHEVFSRLAQFPCPSIAAVHGYALGGGFELALACDLRIADNTARFAFPETGLGITPGFGGTQRLARLTNPALAAELIFSGRQVKAEEAYAKGIVNMLCSEDELKERSLELAQKIVTKAPIAVRQAKKALYQGLDEDLDDGLELEAELFGECFSSQDQKKAMSAYLNKEKFKDFQNK